VTSAGPGPLDPRDPDGRDRDPRDGPERPGQLAPTPPTVLAVVAIVGLVGGWLLHPLSDRVGSPPLVGWSQPVLLGVVALVLGGAAWTTWRTVHVQHRRLAPHQALNRLALARACAYVGALMLGGYAGYALSWLGSSAELADQRMLRAGLAALAGLLVTITALLLERACRIRSDPPAH